MFLKKLYSGYLNLLIETTGIDGRDKIIPYESLKDSIIEIYENEYKHKFDNIEDLEPVFEEMGHEHKVNTINYIVSYHCKKHGIENSVEKISYQKKLKNHPFFCKKKIACSAPFTTLRFDFDGLLTVCCINRTHDLGSYPNTTLEEAWFGDKLKQLQTAMQEYDFSLGCQHCAHHVLIGNGLNTILHQTNSVFPVTEPDTRSYPQRLIFQLHNTCNYECIMCSGEYSSSICKNRDNSIPNKCVYDDNFIEQLKPFLQHAKQVEFLGGEPFLNPLYYKIWELIKEINPSMLVSITTNGSIYSDKIERILQEMQEVRLVVSIDSLDTDTYAYIRRKGNLNNVLTNIEKFITIGKMYGIAFCPIIQNVYEIPKFIEYCAERDLSFCINNTTGLIDGKDLYSDLYENGTRARNAPQQNKEPFIKEFRLHTLTKEEKQAIKEYLLQYNFPTKYRSTVDSFVNFLINF